MTHPTIEAAEKAIAFTNHRFGKWHDEAIAAARVILSAPVSDAEVEVVSSILHHRFYGFITGCPRDWAEAKNNPVWAEIARAALTAFLAQRRKELGVG